MQSLSAFFQLFAWFSIRGMWHHKGRALTVLFGVALGAAVFTGVRLSIHASMGAFTRSVAHITGSAEHVVIRPGGRLPETLIAPLLKHPAVMAASPVLSTYVRCVGSQNEPFLLIGLDPLLDHPLRQWQTVGSANRKSSMWSTLINKPNTFIAGRSLADRYGWREGDPVSIEHANSRQTLHLVGILSGQGLGLAEGGSIAITDIATYQELTGYLGEVDRIDIMLRPNTDSRALAGIQDLFDDDIIVRPASAMRESGKTMIRAYQLNLSILSFASLFVGMFLVYSLVALNAATRRKELAILRSTGASPTVIFSLFLSEGAMFGLVGWLMAIPISSLLIKYLLHGVSQTISTLFVRIQVDTLTLSGWEIFISFILTVVIALAAALQPALEAMRVAPKEVLSDSWQSSGGPDASRRPAAWGMVLIGLVLPMSKLPGLPGVPIPGYVAIVFLFAGFALLAPWLLRRMGRILSPLLRRFFGVPAYLAGRYVRDSGTRTAVSVGALITAVALYTSLVIMIFSFRETVKQWVEQTVSGDYFVAARMAEINGFKDPLSPETMAALKNLQSPVEMVPSRRFLLDYGKTPYQLEGMDLKAFMKHGGFIWLHGNPAATRSQLFDGRGVLVSEVFSTRTGLKVGDIFRARVQSVRISLPILGVIRDYRTKGGVVFCDLSYMNRQFHDLRWTGVRFFLDAGSVDPDGDILRLQQEIIARCGAGLEMISGRRLRTSVLRIFDETFAVTSVLLLIALVVAALGITTTLTVLVLERRRQLNTLLAVGAAMGQIRTMILWEALLMVAAGQGAGFGCGFILSYLLIFVINRQSFGWTFAYQVDWVTLLWSLPMIALTALAAALPAMRAVFRDSPAMLLRGDHGA